MFRAKCQLESMGPISFGRRYEEKAPKEEDAGDHDRATWKGRLHVNGDGECIIPAGCFKTALYNTSRILGERIAGRGQSTYTSRFKAGVIVENDVLLNIKPDNVPYEDVYVPSDGKSGGQSPQVLKRFPKISKWKGTISVLVMLDQIITQKKFEEYIKMCGQIAGVGRYRPERGGHYGRFKVNKIEFEKVEL